jgi:hypothetical protein
MGHGYYAILAFGAIVSKKSAMMKYGRIEDLLSTDEDIDMYWKYQDDPNMTRELDYNVSESISELTGSRIQVVTEGQNPEACDNYFIYITRTEIHEDTRGAGGSYRKVDTDSFELSDIEQVQLNEVLETLDILDGPGIIFYTYEGN